MLLTRYSKQELIEICEHEGLQWVQQQLAAELLLDKPASPIELEVMAEWAEQQRRVGGLKSEAEQAELVRAALDLATEASAAANQASKTANRAYGLAGFSMLVALGVMALSMAG